MRLAGRSHATRFAHFNLGSDPSRHRPLAIPLKGEVSIIVLSFSLFNFLRHTHSNQSARPTGLRKESPKEPGITFQSNGLNLLKLGRREERQGATPTLHSLRIPVHPSPRTSFESSGVCLRSACLQWRLKISSHLGLAPQLPRRFLLFIPALKSLLFPLLYSITSINPPCRGRIITLWLKPGTRG